jgi:hypothetical protein
MVSRAETGCRRLYPEDHELASSTNSTYCFVKLVVKKKPLRRMREKMRFLKRRDFQ